MSDYWNLGRHFRSNMQENPSSSARSIPPTQATVTYKLYEYTWALTSLLHNVWSLWVDLDFRASGDLDKAVITQKKKEIVLTQATAL